MDEDRSFTRRAAGAAGRYGTLRLLRTIPIVGSAVSVVLVGQNLHRKGYPNGLVDSALDITPVLGRFKAVTEFFWGDWIPPKAGRTR